MDLENAKAQMRKGVLELCILAIAAEEEVYPNDIIARLKSNDLIVVEGTLYPLLTRLKNDGLLEYSWRESTSGPPRKYFKTTTDGQSFLSDLTMSWEKLVQSVALTLRNGDGAAPKMTDTDVPDTETAGEAPASNFFDE